MRSFLYFSTLSKMLWTKIFSAFSAPVSSRSILTLVVRVATSSPVIGTDVYSWSDILNLGVDVFQEYCYYFTPQKARTPPRPVRSHLGVHAPEVLAHHLPHDFCL